MASDGTTAARLFVEVGARGISETASGLGRMDAAVRGSSQGISGLVKAAGGIYAVKKGFDATIGSAISWESAFAGVEKTVDASDAQLAQLEGTLRGMSRTMPVAAEDLADIAANAGALGIKTEAIDEFTDTVAKIGATTNVSTEQASSALGHLSNVLGLTEDDFDNFGAALVDLGNKGASTEQDILAIAERAGAGASLIDIAADSTLGWSAAVANLGIEAEAGGSALQRFFLEMSKHVNTAGAELDAIAETAGMTASEFQRAFGEDSSAALQSFIVGLGNLDAAGQQAVLDMLGFNDVRISRALLGLAGNTDNLTDSLKIGQQAWQTNTALAVEYGKRADTTAAKIEVLGNRLADLGRRAGESAPFDFVLGAADASVSGWERMFASLEVNFDEGASRLSAKMEDKGNFLRNNFLSEFIFGDEVKNQIIDNMMDWGTSLEETIDLMEKGLTPALVDSGKAWEDYQNQITATADASNNAVESMGNPVSNYRAKIDGLSDATAEEMADARKAAVDGMADILDAIRGSIRDDKDAYKSDWEDYLDGANSVFTDDARSKFIAGEFSGDAFNDGLHSKDSARVQDTVDFVNAQLTEFDLLNPGVLAIGQKVPASMQEGMEEIWPELQAYLDQKHIDSIDSLTLEEAKQLGIDGIYLWFQGMQEQEETDKFVAGAIATRAANELSLDLYNEGYHAGDTWAEGLRDAATAEMYAAAKEAGAGVYGILGINSEPKDPNSPLRGITEWGGNAIKTIADDMRSHIGEIVSASDAAGAAFSPDLYDGGGVNVAAFGGSGGAAPGAPTEVNIYLTVEGDLKADSAEAAAATLSRVMDLRLGSVG